MSVARLREPLVDLGLVVVMSAGTMVTVAVGDDADDPGPTGWTYAYAVVMSLPMLARRRWPLPVLLVTSALMFLYYNLGFPGIAPTTVLAIPIYTATLAGWIWWSAGVVVLFYIVGVFMLTVVDGNGVPEVIVGAGPHIVLSAVVILLAEVVRGRRALAAETRERLRRAEQEREVEAARRVAEERLRIARELHDTVAHSMATIAVQAGSALHRLKGDDQPDGIRAALSAIRVTSKDALNEMRATLGLLRSDDGPPQDAAGLDRLPALVEAVRAAGVPVELETRGPARPLAAPVDHAAYRILQESLTNVLRHAGPGAQAWVRVCYGEAGVDLEVDDDGSGTGTGLGTGGHGLGGMRERAESVGGTLTTGPRPAGGFAVSAHLPERTA